MPIERSKIKGKSFIFDISLPSTVSTDGRKHWILVLEDGTYYAWSHFSKKSQNWMMWCWYNYGVWSQQKVSISGTSIVIMLVRMNFWKVVQTGRDGGKICIYCTQYATIKQKNWAKICYPLCWCSSYGEWGEIFSFSRYKLVVESAILQLYWKMTWWQKSLSPIQHFWERKMKHFNFNEKTVYSTIQSCEWG